MIISGGEALQKALEKFDAGDPTTLEAMLDSGALNRKSSSIDLLDDLDLGFLNVGSLGDTPKDEVGVLICYCFLRFSPSDYD